MWACVRDQPKVVKALLTWPYIILNAQNTVKIFVTRMLLLLLLSHDSLYL